MSNYGRTDGRMMLKTKGHLGRAFFATYQYCFPFSSSLPYQWRAYCTHLRGQRIRATSPRRTHCRPQHGRLQDVRRLIEDVKEKAKEEKTRKRRMTFWHLFMNGFRQCVIRGRQSSVILLSSLILSWSFASTLWTLEFTSHLHNFIGL